MELKSTQQAFLLGDFAELLELRNADGLPYILIGGQAVNYWAEHCISEDPGLRELLPFTSKDIDFNGDRKDVKRIAEQLNLCPFYPRPVEMTALAGFLKYKLKGVPCHIEVVRKIPGVSGSLEELAIHAEWAGREIRVLDPISLFAYKLQLATTVSQVDRQDVHHLKILILCVRAFLREFLNNLNDNELRLKGWLGATTRIIKLTTRPRAKKAAVSFGINWADLLPLAEIESCQNKRIIQFREKQLPRWNVS